MGHNGEFWQNVVLWRREWQTTSLFLPWEPYEQYEKAGLELMFLIKSLVFCLSPPHFKDIKNDKNEMNEWKKSIHTVFHCGSQQGSSTGSGAGKPPRHPRLASCLLAGLCGLVFSVPEAKSPHIRELGTPSSDFLTLSCHQQLSWHFRPQGRGGEQRTLPETLLGTPWQADGEVPGIPWNS